MFNEIILKTLTTLSGIVFFAAFYFYIKAVLKDRNRPQGEEGKTEPSKATWIIWATLDSITLAGMAAEHKLNGQIIGAVSGAWIVVLLALWYGTSGWTRLDKLCLGGAALGLSLWYLFKSPTMGIVVSNTVIFLGSFPTFISAWRDPGRENRLAWTIYWSSCVLAVLAIPSLTLVGVIQPVTFFVIESVMMCILWVRPLVESFLEGLTFDLGLE